MDIKVYHVKSKVDWVEVVNACRTTVGKPPLNDVKEKWKWRTQLLKSEHSPIRKIVLGWKWENLPSWISVHFVRHKFGIEHFVSTQRDDRTGKDRSERSQTDPVIHECEANAQAIINMSRKRLCIGQAHHETTFAWQLFLDHVVRKECPELYTVCVPECVYRGFCPEFNSKCNGTARPVWTELRSLYINPHGSSIADHTELLGEWTEAYAPSGE